MTPPADGQFPNTSWTLIARLKSDDEAVASAAIETLYTQYHFPLYCYLRRRGCAFQDAEDVLHDFLAGLLRRRSFDRLDESRGRLRGWFCTALGRHLQEWQGRERRREAEPLPHGVDVDFARVEARYQREHAADHDAPDRVFEREWVREIFRSVLASLTRKYEARGRGALFAVLRPVLETGGSLRDHDSATLAETAGMSQDALRAALARLLREFREGMHAEVRLTVEHAGEVDDELAYLMSLFRS